MHSVNYLENFIHNTTPLHATTVTKVKILVFDSAW